MIAAFATPSIDWGALSPYLALLAGVALVMLASVFVPGSARNASAPRRGTLPRRRRRRRDRPLYEGRNR